MRRNMIGWVILLVSIVVLFNGVYYQRTSAKDGVVWEYTSLPAGGITVNVDPLNKLGADGWELVAIKTPDPNDAADHYLYYLFKRAKR